MVNIILYPSIEHCIESTAKKAYLHLQREILDTHSAENDIAERLMLLEDFLRHADFRKLRAESEHLLKDGKHVKFVIYLENGALKYEIS